MRECDCHVTPLYLLLQPLQQCSVIMSILTSPSRKSRLMNPLVYHCVPLLRLKNAGDHREKAGTTRIPTPTWGLYSGVRSLPVGYTRLSIRSSKPQSRLTIDSGFNKKRHELIPCPALRRDRYKDNETRRLGRPLSAHLTLLIALHLSCFLVAFSAWPRSLS